MGVVVVPWGRYVVKPLAAVIAVRFLGAAGAITGFTGREIFCLQDRGGILLQTAMQNFRILDPFLSSLSLFSFPC